MNPISFLARRSFLSAMFGVALLFAAAGRDTASAVAADTSGNGEAAIMLSERLREIALKLYPADDIIGDDRSGDYDLPEGANSLSAIVARILLQVGAAYGDSTDHQLVGIMLESGAGGPRDYVSAREHYRLSGDRVALWRLGLLVHSGRGGPADAAAARAIFKQSAALGLIDARFEYGRMLEIGDGGEQDQVEARKIYESTLNYCHGDIANHLAMMLMRGIGGPVDSARAAQMHLKAVSCHNRFYEDPVVVAAPNLIDEQTSAEIKRLLEKCRPRPEIRRNPPRNTALKPGALPI